ncbi:MAG: peptidoglycan DD-metalloendopeptidase family protein [Rickettsia endosymbiont of Sergentomyia squamirostris]|uniref:Peptidoglycan DD-metalloendopeptidase family protein n=1 Tax=Candidatus Tisiphia endosymbiont of Sergentomyia squamirostris TaxID=3113639 RepID=A0AAT9G983_9RICK
MQAIIRLILTNPKINSKFRTGFSYFSIFLFMGFATFVSLSINKFVSDTMSMTIAEPEILESSEGLSNEISQIITVKKGDTLKAILLRQQIPNNEINQIIKLVKDKNIESSLKIGQQLVFDYEIKIIEQDDEDLAAESRTLNKLTIAYDKVKSLEIIREGEDFLARDVTKVFNKLLTKSSVVINSNFMSALKSLGLSSNSIIEMINSYSYQIDFQRQIKSGDTVTVITEKFVTEDGKFSHHGKVLYVSLNLSGKEYNIFRYSPNNAQNNNDFFSEDGKSVKRSLLRTPVKLVRISSHYGNRHHPTLGYTKMHKGVDFAAPTGTPIYAAGNGVITEIGWKSGYGKFIEIKHSQNLSTAYAHASNFAKNLKLGSIVKQGQVIAYVGSTGRTTGSHLHYEVKIGGKNINPMHVKSTPGIELAGKQLAKFKQFKSNVRSLSNELDNKSEIAENSATKFLKS